MLNILSPLKRYWNSHVGYRCIILDGVKSCAVVKGRNFYCNGAGLFHITFAVVELQPSLLHRLDDVLESTTDKDLTEFYQQSQWMAKATKLKLPKQAQLSSRL